MLNRLRHFVSLLADAFWLLPAALVLVGGVLAFLCLRLDHRGLVPDWLLESAWLYNGGPTGARTLLGAVASSAIGVAGTVFSITIAALSLAAGQMGPRLLRNFVSDRGNQLTLGVLLATFTYALIVLRSVRAEEEGGGFTPHLSMSVGIALALCSVAMLIYFVGHVATRINVDTVIGLVGEDLQRSFRGLMAGGDEEAESTAHDGAAEDGDPVPVCSDSGGYLQSVDTQGLADWACERRVVLRLRVRPGHYVFPGVPVVHLSRAVEGADRAVGEGLVLGPVRTPYDDPEFAIRQLVEVAMRALSPGINDPYSAVSVIDRLGGALCELAGVVLPTGRHLRDGRLVLSIPAVDYAGLVDAMFHPLRQYGGTSAMVLIHLLEVLTEIARCEKDPGRMATLQRHADLVLAQGVVGLRLPADLADLRDRHERFRQVLLGEPA